MDLQFNELDCYRLLIVKLVKHLAISRPDNSCYELSLDLLRLYNERFEGLNGQKNIVMILILSKSKESLLWLFKKTDGNE